jgi:natural product biosynthesis luciferase-like monooxygenase protein
MDTGASPSAYLIGGDSLLTQCGEVLLEQGFELRGVITREPRLVAWAAERGLPWIDLDGDWVGALRGAPFDFLFAITHLELIPAEALALPRVGSVNFHDAPLPDLAGLFCPVWALVECRPEHGVTWHWITEGIDAGEVLAQARFALEAGETSLSLNTRCFEVGLELFGELAARLKAGERPSTPQGDGARRLCLGHQRPEGLGHLDFGRSGAELERLVRALDFGPYPNGFARAWFDTARGPVAAGHAEVVAGGAPVAPGAVVEVSADGLVVGTGNGALRLSAFADRAGRTLAAAELGHAVGSSLPRTQADTLKALRRWPRGGGRHERAWVERCLRAEPAELPYALEAIGGAAEWTCELPAALRGLDEGDLAAVWLAALGGFLGRCGAGSEAHVLVAGRFHAELPETLNGWVAPAVPAPIAVDLDTDWNGAVQRQGERWRELAKQGTFLLDLPARYPQLHGRAEWSGERALPIALDLAGTGRVLGAVATLCIESERVRFLPGPQATGDVLERFAQDLLGFLRRASASAGSLAQVDLLDDRERESLLEQARATAAPLDEALTLQDLFAATADRRGTAPALTCEGASLTYAELEARANAVAARLIVEGVGPEQLVGVHLERSLDLVVAVLGVLKSGAAYLPLDPDFPAERLQWMLEDSGAALVLTETALAGRLPGAHRELSLDGETWNPAERPGHGATGASLAYTLYTSGSTGRPKGVQIEHRNVVNFGLGMDERVPHDPADPGTWLALTSLSFDISVLELLWTLTRGFHVVVHRERERVKTGGGRLARPVNFSLFLWGNDDGEGPAKYRLLMDAAKFADERGFEAIWTPERHFHAFGGPFPNPSVISAALAATTERLAIRSGSVVAPLHHPIRIAEEWAVVDNLSNGRVGISFASGWQPDDFVLMPDAFAENKRRMFEIIEDVRKLWRGEEVAYTNPFGEAVPRLSLPRPLQPELPVWVTSAGNPETYVQAGQAGANVLTHLLGQSVAEVAEKIAIYRRARAEAGHDPETGRVTLMLHSFLGDDVDAVREQVRGPMKAYLDSSMGLVKKYAWSFPAFKKPEGATTQPEIDLDRLSDEERDALLEHSFARYFETSGLFGTPESLRPFVERLAEIGVDEIGCLIDYGVDAETMLASLEPLDRLRAWAAGASDATSEQAPDEDAPWTVARCIETYGVTHLQCTPSHARLLLADAANRRALASVEQLCIGGEALPRDLAVELRSLFTGRLTNMFGPTETTIWSSTWDVPQEVGGISIGTPIANTQMFVLDAGGRPLPTGVPGALWIGGAGVARGYLGREDLTAERFVPSEWAAGERLYRTGDVAARRPDGTLLFLGRDDHQVKVRGYRIELGEIEARLAEAPGVEEAVVIAREDTPGDPRLVAYLRGSATSQALRQHLAQSLPEYMVPSAFATLERFPLTPNGKIDRRALPKPERQAELAEEQRPLEGVEALLASLWTAVLGLERIGREQNFFELGGHSLLVVQLQRDLERELERQVSLTDLYRFPTIRGLANHLEAAADGTPQADATVSAGAQRGANRRAAMAARRSARRGR